MSMCFSVINPNIFLLRDQILSVASHAEDFPLDAGETSESLANDKQATSQKRREQVRKAQRYVFC